jgi:hypothetical protein
MPINGPEIAGTPWRRSPVRPLLEGDELAGRRVAGFAWRQPGLGMPSSHRDDRLLFDGDESLAAPPDRAVPITSENARELAPMPPEDLPDDTLRRPANAFDGALDARARSLINLPGALWQPMAPALFAAVHGTGHRIWIAGGAARDLLRGRPLEEIKDLDLSGTAPAGRFADLAYQTARALGLSESTVSVTPGSLVCAVVKRRKRLFEYRGLTRGGFRFPAVGSRLAEDAGHRDYTVNALLYDLMDKKVYDPCGRGLDHLLGSTCRFVPLSPDSTPFSAAALVLRTLKFTLRWEAERPDFTAAFGWMERLDPAAWTELTALNWDSLHSRWREIPESVDDQLRVTRAWPSVARTLIDAVIGRG